MCGAVLSHAFEHRAYYTGDPFLALLVVADEDVVDTAIHTDNVRGLSPRELQAVVCKLVCLPHTSPRCLAVVTQALRVVDLATWTTSFITGSTHFVTTSAVGAHGLV